MTKLRTVGAIGLVLMIVGINALDHERAIAQESDGQVPANWVAEIEKVFIRSENASSAMTATMKSGRASGSKRRT